MDVASDSPVAAALGLLVAAGGSLGIVDRRTQRRIDNLEDRQGRMEAHLERQDGTLAMILAEIRRRK